MPDDPRVQRLLDELLDPDATPEAVCSSCVEVLPAVRDRWRQVCHARAELDALFPPAVGPGASRPAPLPDATAPPSIPGCEVQAVLGVGGMGVVFRARHVRLSRVVAVKMALAGGPRGRTRGRGSSARRRPSRRCGTRTSCRSTRSARRAADRTSAWSTSRAAPSGSD